MPIARKKQSKQDGAPAWMVTYADMVTLLLTFFVLLLSMMELKKEQKLMEFMEAIKQAFGYRGGVRQMPLEPVMDPKNVNLTEMLVVPIYTQDFSKSNDEGVRGKREKVRPIRDAEMYAIGAPIRFDELKAELTPTEQAAVAGYAEQLRGYATQIVVRGHCSPRPVDGTEFADHTALAYARARAVRDVLVANGISQRRIVMHLAGPNEPLATQAYRDAERARNDIVEILQRHVAMQELYAEANVNQ